MADYINGEVHQSVADASNINVSVVSAIDKFRCKMMAKVIKEDNPNVSIKLDYWGNLYSHPKNRERIEKLQKKRNGQSISNSR